MPAASKKVKASKERYPAYPSCLPTAQYFTIGSRFLASAATAAALKCSIFFPNYTTFQLDPSAGRQKTNPHRFTNKPKLLLDCLPWCNLARCPICAEKVPSIESGEILDCSQELIAADSSWNELEVVSNGRVVNQGISDHLDYETKELKCWNTPEEEEISSCKGFVWRFHGSLWYSCGMGRGLKFPRFMPDDVRHQYQWWFLMSRCCFLSSISNVHFVQAPPHFYFLPITFFELSHNAWDCWRFIPPSRNRRVLLIWSSCSYCPLSAKESGW